MSSGQACVNGNRKPSPRPRLESDRTGSCGHPHRQPRGHAGGVRTAAPGDRRARARSIDAPSAFSPTHGAFSARKATEERIEAASLFDDDDHMLNWRVGDGRWRWPLAGNARKEELARRHRGQGRRRGRRAVGVGAGVSVAISAVGAGGLVTAGVVSVMAGVTACGVPARAGGHGGARRKRDGRGEGEQAGGCGGVKLLAGVGVTRAGGGVGGSGGSRARSAR